MTLECGLELDQLFWLKTVSGITSRSHLNEELNSISTRKNSCDLSKSSTGLWVGTKVSDNRMLAYDYHVDGWYGCRQLSERSWVSWELIRCNATGGKTLYGNAIFVKPKFL